MKSVKDPDEKFSHWYGEEVERNPNENWRALGEHSKESSDQTTAAEIGVNVQNA